MGNKYTKYKRDIIKKIRNQFPELTIKQIESVINAYNNQIKKEVNDGHPVNITGMFKVDTVDVEKSYQYNVLTGEYNKCNTKYTRIVFKTSKKWKESLNDKEE